MIFCSYLKKLNSTLYGVYYLLKSARARQGKIWTILAARGMGELFGFPNFLAVGLYFHVSNFLFSIGGVFKDSLKLPGKV